LIWSWSAHFQASPERALIEWGERFRIDLVSGAAALCLIRASLGRIRTNSPPRPPELEAQS
jgi:hypothetical protein